MKTWSPLLLVPGALPNLVRSISCLLARAVCPSCWCETLQLKKEAAQVVMGFSEPLILFCTNSHCNYSSETVYSSPKIQDSSRQAYEVNSLMTMYATEIGKGHSALQKLQQFFDISIMSYTSYKVHLDKIKIISQMSTDVNLKLAVQKIKTANESGLCDDNVTNVTVSFDGTWQKRGFSSKLGVGVAIEVQTGLVVDFEVLSTYCHACCLAVKRFQNNDAALNEWKKTHTKCSINYTGSPKAMEAEAAKRIWMRSIQKHGLRYTSILSDGDASTFAALTTAMPYGDKYPIAKMDCVNHADKRFGTAIRKAMKEKKLGGRDIGRLTENKAALLQNYYGGAIRKNAGDASKMRKAIWASLLHPISTDDNPLHQDCPDGPESWCKYNKALALNLPVPKHGPATCKTFLAPEVGKELINIYERMTDVNLLERMQSGATQNANESCNNLIWVHCPKNTFVFLSTLQAGVQTAISKFNAGATATSNRIKLLGIEPTLAQKACMQKVDRKRLSNAKRAADASIKRAKKNEAGRGTQSPGTVRKV